MAAEGEAPPWVRDNEADECPKCLRGFTFIRRKHHCRRCGGLRCKDCCNKFEALPEIGFPKPVRTCNETCETPAAACVTEPGLKTGFLEKLPGPTSSNQKWQRRWIVLKGSTLMYFDDAREVGRKGTVNVIGYALAVDPTVDNGFTIGKRGERSFRFRTKTEEQREEWMEAFKAATEWEDDLARTPEITESLTLHSGWMEKVPSDDNTREHVEKWKRRWFVLEEGALFYFGNNAEKDLKGVIFLEGYQVESSDVEYHLLLRRMPPHPELTYHFRTEGNLERLAWLDKIKMAIDRTTSFGVSYFPHEKVPGKLHVTQDAVSFVRPEMGRGRSRWETVWEIPTVSIVKVMRSKNAPVFIAFHTQEEEEPKRAYTANALSVQRQVRACAPHLASKSKTGKSGTKNAAG